jgi:hypothetical protein
VIVDFWAPEDASALLARLPNLGAALQNAPKQLKRQVFEAFCLQISYDKLNGCIEISATITEAIADALENAKDLPEEVSNVTQRDIAGARFVPSERRSDQAGIPPGGLKPRLLSSA